MTKPLMVLISDIHFNLNNLELSSKALRAALTCAEELCVPLVLCGDTNDTKAIIRAEVANELINILKNAETQVYILCGNHDLVNEKGKDHGLNYLKPYAIIIDEPGNYEYEGIYFIPYQSHSDKFAECLSKVKPGSIIIMHQGVQGAEMGDYVIDKTSVKAELLQPFAAFSGHYHRHQQIGSVTFIGNPFTMSFGESNDGAKGFLIVNSDGSFRQVALDYRRHVKRTLRANRTHIESFFGISKRDLLWLTIEGSKSELKDIDKKSLEHLVGHQNFKLDKVVIDGKEYVTAKKDMTNEETFDTVISELPEPAEYKEKLKRLWREVVSEDTKS